MIALVVRRYRHYRTGAIAHEYKVGDPDRYGRAAEGMNGLIATVHAELFRPIQIRLRGPAALTLLDKCSDFGIVCRCLLRQRMLRRQRHVGRALQRIRARAVDFQHLLMIDHLKPDLGTVRAADPVALHGLDRFRPARQVIQTIQQFIGVRADLEKPLRNFTPLNQRPGAPATAFHHLLVGEHGLIHRIPVHFGQFVIHQALFHQPCKHQLFPAVILRVTGGKLARPVQRKTQLLQLFAHLLDVVAGPFCRRHAVLDGGVFRRQAKRIPAHRLQYVFALQALVAADHIANGIIAHMADMQCPAGIRQHRQAVVFFRAGLFGGFELPGLRPALLNFGFDQFGIVSGLHSLLADPSGVSIDITCSSRSAVCK